MEIMYTKNLGTHLDAGISNNKLWQDYYNQLIVYPSQTNDAPNGTVGRYFINTLADLMNGVRECKWNMERFILFQIIMLQRSQEVKRVQDIKRRLSHRMEMLGTTVNSPCSFKIPNEQCRVY